MEPRRQQATVAADGATSDPPRLPPLGKYEGLPPLHTWPFEIEQNVSRIAAQIAEGRPATYD